MAYINGKKLMFAPKIVQVGLDTSHVEDFSCFAANNRFSEAELEYINTARGTNFDSMCSKCDNLTKVPDWDTSKGEDFRYMFAECEKLEHMPNLDFSQGKNFLCAFSFTAITEVENCNFGNGIDFQEMFYRCYEISRVGNLDVSNGKIFSWMFGYCSALTSVGVLNTSQGTQFSSMFKHCNALHTIAGIDLSNAIYNYSLNMFPNSLENITFNGVLKLNNFSLSTCTKLTVESLLSAFNALEDKASYTGETIWTISIGSTNKAKLTDEQLAIALNKGWVVQ